MPASPSSPGRATLPLFALGFRPMYLLAGAFAAVSVLAWAARFSGWIAPGYAGPLWHAHEMIFGFTLAVMVGFLFTAGRNWSGQATPTGLALAGIAALWVAARVLAVTPWSAAAAWFDIAFGLAAAAGLGSALWRGGNSRNYFFVAILLAFVLLNAAFHLAASGRIDIDASRVLQAALDIVLFAIVVMAGRVVPMFTNNAIPGAGATRLAWLEKVSLASVLALALADVAHVPATWLAPIAALAALAHAWRLALWKPLATWRHPLVWILHAAYAWIVVHLALRCLAALGYAAPGLATHALTAGAIGGLTLGMMTRTSRGHTGRTLVASRADFAAYALVMCAAVARVFVPMAFPGATMPAIVASGFLWSGAFAIFLFAYWPVLSRPRLDGQPG